MPAASALHITPLAPTTPPAEAPAIVKVVTSAFCKLALATLANNLVPIAAKAEPPNIAIPTAPTKIPAVTMPS